MELIENGFGLRPSLEPDVGGFAPHGALNGIQGRDPLERLGRNR